VSNPVTAADLSSVDPEVVKRIRHSCAHILAQAVVERFSPEGDVQVAIGPPTGDGFYYDFGLPRTINPDDLEWLEARMREVVNTDLTFDCEEISVDRARDVFAGQVFKGEIIDGVVDGNSDEWGNPVEHPVPLTIYRHGGFTDLCAGPHVHSTNDIDPKAFKLIGTAGAYWRGSETRPMLQRIYGTAWETQDQLEAFLAFREEAAQRDHRRLGRELELFFLDGTAPGMPYWLPNGMRLMNTLLAFWREIHEAEGYHEISAPIVNDRSLWEISGHWDHYRDEMFIIPVDDHRVYGVKPMNCPNAMLVFNTKTRSYRDLPLRLSDCDILHRNERSGTLHGLLRVQAFHQDDAHIFLEPSQLPDEFEKLFSLTDLFYSTFGLKHRLRLGTRPESFVGDIETWNMAEDTLRRILDARVGPKGYLVVEGDGAFYGPKIDILMADALGREWQMGTFQLDFQLPGRFGCHYDAPDGSRQTPVVVHRVIYGSLERFIGILIEDTNGAFPPWLAPEQVWVVAARTDAVEYAQSIYQQLRERKVRVELKDPDEKLGLHIFQAHKYRIPYVLVVGTRECDQDTVTVRCRGSRENLTLGREEFLDAITSVIEKRELKVDALLLHRKTVEESQGK
jgi:threonyl-tRNA synthetase